MTDFKAHLKRQLAFLERSANSYDAGHQDEAIRMAVVIRVLLHQTDKSTSLLTHLEFPEIRLVTTARQSVEPGTVFFLGLGVVSFGPNGSSMEPFLESTEQSALIPAPQWWKQVVFIFNETERLTRKQIVLAAANQDGGAHVDSKLSVEYAKLARDGALGHFVTVRGGSQSLEPVTHAHFVAIRQMTHELLNSHELLLLAGP